MMRNPFKKKPDAVDPAVAKSNAEAGLPLSLMVGSVRGGTVKDVLLYASAVAARSVSAPELTSINVHSDIESGRTFYEIHEGGACRALLPKLLGKLAEHGKVAIPLANGAWVEIADENDEVYTLVFTAGAEVPPTSAEEKVAVPVDLTEIQGEGGLKPLIPSRENLFALGGLFIAVGAATLIASLGFLGVSFLQANDASQLARLAGARLLTESPVWQLHQAKVKALGRPIAEMRFDGKAWTVNYSEALVGVVSSEAQDKAQAQARMLQAQAMQMPPAIPAPGAQTSMPTITPKDIQ